MKKTTTYFKYLEHPNSANSQFVENHERVVKPIFPNWRESLTFEEKMMSCGCCKGDKARLVDDVKPQKPNLPRTCQKSSSLQERRKLVEKYTFKFENRDTRHIANSSHSRRRWCSSGKFPSCSQSQVDTLHQIMGTERRTKMLEIGNLYSLKNRSDRSSDQRMNERKLEQIFNSKRRTEALYDKCLQNIKNLSHEVDKYYQGLERELKEFSSHLKCSSEGTNEESTRKLSSLLSSSTHRAGNLKSNHNDDESGSNDATTNPCVATRHYPSQQDLRVEKASKEAVQVDRMTTLLSLTAIEEGSKMKKENEKSLINCPAETSNSFNHHVDKVDIDKRIFDVSEESLKMNTSRSQAHLDSHVDLKEQDPSSSTLKNISFQIHKTSTFLSSEEILKKSMSIRRNIINNTTDLETDSSSLLNISENDSEGILNETVKNIINFSNA